MRPSPAALAALSAAEQAARSHGLAWSSDSRILHESTHVVARLGETDVIARVALPRTRVGSRRCRDHLERELQVSRHLLESGVGVASPSSDLPPGPHAQGRYLVTFWRRVEHDPDARFAPAEAVDAAARLHEALSTYRGALPELEPLAQLPELIDRLELERQLDPADLSLLRAAFRGVTDAIERLDLPGRPLHGDLHLGNLLKGPSGLHWVDFEDVCHGPVEWDVASLAKGFHDAEMSHRALEERYGSAMDMQRLGPFLGARNLQVVVWGLWIGEPAAGRAGFDAWKQVVLAWFPELRA